MNKDLIFIISLIAHAGSKTELCYEILTSGMVIKHGEQYPTSVCASIGCRNCILNRALNKKHETINYTDKLRIL